MPERVSRFNHPKSVKRRRKETAMGNRDEDLMRMGKAMGPLAEIIRQVQKGELTSEQLQAVVEHRNPFELETYKVMVDYGKSLSKMIEAGKYDEFNDDINDKHFPIQGAGSPRKAGQHEAELMLVHLNWNATTKEVLEHLNSQGLEPARLEYLLVFGAAYPELQRQFPIIALGSVWVIDGGSRRYPYLRSNDDERRLILSWAGDGNHWHETCRFLAVRK